MRIGKKIILNSLLTSIISIVICCILIGFLSYYKSKEMLGEKTKQQLITLRDMQAKNIVNYFEMFKKQILSYSDNYTILNAMRDFKIGFLEYVEQAKMKTEVNYKSKVIKHYIGEFSKEYAKLNHGASANAAKLINVLNETTFALQYNYILQNPYDIEEKSKLNFVNDGTDYSAFHKKYHPKIRAFKEAFGLYDIFLVDAISGNIVYSVSKELDFTTSLIDGPYAQTGIGQAFRKAKAAAKDNSFVTISDFSEYLPSYDQQESFMATPIFDEFNKNQLGVLIFQIPVKVINDIMTNKQNWQEIGLGKTGESYLIGKDYKLRSMSRFFVENEDEYLYTMYKLKKDQETIQMIETRGTDIGLAEIDTYAANEVNHGHTGFGIYQDYRNKTVVGAFEPINILDLHLGVICEVDADEAFAAARILALKILIYAISVAAIICLFSIILGTILSFQISSPIESFCQEINAITRDRDLTRRIPVYTKDEIGEMAIALNSFIESFKITCEQTMASTKEMYKEANRLMEIADEYELDAEETIIIKEASDNIEELSDKLQMLSEQFMMIEEESDRVNSW